MNPIGMTLLLFLGWGVYKLFSKETFEHMDRRPCPCGCEDGFGLIEAVLAMFIAGIVVSVIMATMVASVRNMDRTVDTHEAITTSENASTVFRTATETGEWDTAVVVSPNRMIWATDGGTACQEWEFHTGTVINLDRKEWLVGEPYPPAWETVLTNVQSGSLGLEDSTFVMAVTVKVEESLPVTTERLSDSSFTPPPPEDPPVERVNPCVA